MASLRKYGITTIADVRSVPYSRFRPEFNRDRLELFLNDNSISYMYLGDCCGARVDGRDCYVNGKVDFGRVSKSERFIEGLSQIRRGMMTCTMALMCAERDPITCHRSILICRHLRSDKIRIKHIWDENRVEDNEDSERRLMKHFKLNNADLFRSEEERLNEAYNRQSERITYADQEKR